MAMADIVNILSGFAGVIGAVTGAVSLIEVRKIRSLDLRMKKGQLLNSIQIGLGDLGDLGQKADQSRIYRLAAQGLSQSGAMQKWKESFERNKKNIEDLSGKFLAIKKNGQISGKTLESHILELHLVEEQIRSLTSGFSSSIAEDDVARDRLSRMKFGA
jgi:hypothetical protein